MRFKDRVVIISAAASGIGRAIAGRFASEGARLAICDFNASTLETAAEELSAISPGIVHAVVDVSDFEAVQRFVAKTADTFGRLDIVVNNAGIGLHGDVTSISPEQWRRVMSVTLDSVFFFAKETVPHLAASKGAIVNIASISGMFGDYGFAGYTARQGRRDQPDTEPPRVDACASGHTRQLRLSWPHRDACHEMAARRGNHRKPERRQDPARPAGTSGRNCRHGRVSGVRRCILCHRDQHARGWRPDGGYRTTEFHPLAQMVAEAILRLFLPTRIRSCRPGTPPPQ